MKCLTIIITFICIGSSTAAFFWGSCPDVTVKSDFRVDFYLGTWYEISRYSPTPFENDNSRCTQAVYSYSQTEAGAIDVENSAILPDGTIDVAEGIVRIPDRSEPAKMKVKFSRFMPAGDYWVLDTDYDTYAMVHSCTNHIFGLFHTQWDWILSRYHGLDDYTLDWILWTFQRQGVDLRPFNNSTQAGCNGTLIWDGDNDIL